MAISRRVLLSSGLTVGIALLAAGPALAHHGWSWTEEGFFEIAGIIRAISYGNPHPTLDVDVEGETWRVELATPAATQRAGFMEDTAKVGDQIVVIGHRSRDEAEKRMKAVRITVNGKTYDVYPNRVPS